MREIKIYQPLGEKAPVEVFLRGLDPRLKEKIMFQIFRVANLHPAEMREPHVKHFVLEKYSDLYELREKSKVLIRIIFTICDGNMILLTPFIKHQKRDSLKALEQSIRILVDIREHPEYITEFTILKEEAI